MLGMVRRWIIHRGKEVKIERTAEEDRKEIERARLEADYLRTHPPEIERISGCCDRADQS